MIKSYGYPAELHRVVTADGYVLEIHRIPGRKGSVSVPVVIQHGLFSSTADFLSNRPPRNLREYYRCLSIVCIFVVVISFIFKPKLSLFLYSYACYTLLKVIADFFFNSVAVFARRCYSCRFVSQCQD